MTAVQWTRVDRVLNVVLDRDPAEWSAALNEACGSDAELRDAVADLLSRLPVAEQFLERPPALTAAAFIDHADSERLAGLHIGAYRIVRQIGRGGMSRVFLAERADGQYEQRVALKLLRTGMDSDVDRARFRSERQILASLEHPHIARLLDGGVTDDGSPYLVLEYVDGQPIDEHCAAQRPTIRQCLALFLEVIDATQYAHRHLVVHRDLKPSNILVTSDGSVKLLDFGLAKLVEPLSPDTREPITRPGQRWMTPEYAAPEQIRGEPVSTLTDVYQLGAVLYDLLTGNPPFGTRLTSGHALEHAVLVDEPSVPRTLPADLVAVVLKALQKEPNERYETARALGDDVRRYLMGHPVLARRQTAAYRARRFVRRHRMGVIAAATILILVLSYSATVFVQRSQIRRALAQAVIGEQKAEQVTDFLLGLFEASEQGRTFGDTVSARELLRRGTLRARELTGVPEVRAEMLDAIGRIHSQLGDFDAADRIFLEVLNTRRKVLGDDHVDVATSLLRLSSLEQSRGSFASATELARRALDIRHRHLGDDDPMTVEAMFWYSQALHGSGDEVNARAAFEAWARAFEKQPPSLTPTRAHEHLRYGQMLEFRGDLEGAKKQFAEASRILEVLYGENHPDVAEAQFDIADVLRAQDSVDKAERIMRTAATTLRAAYPDGHPDLSFKLASLARLLDQVGRFDEAEALYREIEVEDTRALGENHTVVATRREELGWVLAERAKYAEAERYLRDAMRIYQSQFGDSSVMTARAWVSLGDVMRRRGELASAESLLVRAYGVLRDRTSRMAEVSRRRAVSSLVALYEAEGRVRDASRFRVMLTSEK